MKFFTLSFFILIKSSFASTTLSCTHPCLCHMANKLLTPGQNIIILPPRGIPDDLHHFDPNISLIKKWLRSDHLLLAPKELIDLPSLKKHKASLSFTLPNNSSAAEAHFWLSSKMNCLYQKKLQGYLQSAGFKTQKIKCLDHEVLPSLKGKLFILTHDALSAKLSQAGAKVHSLKGSHHHSEIHAGDLKKIYQSLKEKKQAIWIIEKGHHIPHTLKSLQEKGKSYSLNGQDCELYKKLPKLFTKWSAL